MVFLADCLAGPMPPLRFWLALLLWSAAKAAEHGWALLRGCPMERAQGLLGASAATQALALAEAEEDLEPATLSLYQNLVPALPALVLGFCGAEGNELVRGYGPQRMWAGGEEGRGTGCPQAEGGA